MNIIDETPERVDRWIEVADTIEFLGEPQPTFEALDAEGQGMVIDILLARMKFDRFKTWACALLAVGLGVMHPQLQIVPTWLMVTIWVVVVGTGVLSAIRWAKRIRALGRLRLTHIPTWLAPNSARLGRGEPRT